MPDLTIERLDDEWAVYEHSIYERGSVLEGMPRRRWLHAFPTLNEAKQAYPKARVIEGTTRINPDPGPIPPPWWEAAEHGPWNPE